MKVLEPTANASVNLALDTIEKQKQALVFVNTRQSAEKTAEEVAVKLETTPELEELSQQILKVVSSPTKQCIRLAKCVRKGTAFHHSGLAAKQRQLIEDNFRTGQIKIISCTPTLAAGVDLPAFRAIIRDLRRFTSNGLNWIPVLEYLQMAGRAGRPNYDTEGQAIVVTSSEAEEDEVIERYINGEPEKIYSKLAVEPVLRTYVLSLIATRFVKTNEQLIKFFSKTFWAHQFGDMRELENKIDYVLELLESWEFIKTERDEFVSANEANSGRLFATAMGRRVAELYLDPLTAFELLTAIRKGKQKGTTTFAWLQLVTATNEMKPLLRVKVKEYDEFQDELIRVEAELITEEPSVYDDAYDDFMNSVKTALFFQGWIDEFGEDALMEKYGIRPGEIRAKLERADWLLFACEEMIKLLQFKELLVEVTKTRKRVKHGAKEELLTLLRLKGIGRVRARKMYNNKIRDVSTIKATDITTLAQVLGSSKVAADVKEQVGEKVAAIKKGTRKGQTSIEKY